MAISEKAKKITESIYTAYSSSTGVLFGIPPAFRTSVTAIVSAALEIADEYEDPKPAEGGE